MVVAMHFFVSFSIHSPIKAEIKAPHFTYTYNSTAMLVSFSYLCTQKSINNIKL